MTKHGQKGQAIILLLFFVIVSMILTSGAIIVAFVNTQGGTKRELGTAALTIAESGAENALIRLLRNSNYNGGDTFTINGGTVSINVSTSGTTKTIVSTGTVGNFIRKIQVVVDYTNNVLTIQPNSWREIP